MISARVQDTRRGQNTPVGYILEEVGFPVAIIIEQKLHRLRDGACPRFLDLFSGCGGIALGFQRAGALSLGGVELDEYAAESYAVNFHNQRVGCSHESFRAIAAAKDITQTDPLELIALYNHKPEDVDLIVGGPPCPAFTRVGRAKLREVFQHPKAFLQDPRARLYLRYLAFVEALQPIALVLENVPDMLNYGGRNVAEDICDRLEDLGYKCAYTLLNSANYGVPQMRERLVLIGLHEMVGQSPEFPRPLCKVEFPAGYHSSREVALRQVHRVAQHNSGIKPRYVEPLEPPPNAPGPVTVAEAIGDLPPITAHLKGGMPRGPRRFINAVGYLSTVIASRYAIEMRKWPGFESDGMLRDHVTRSLSLRDYRLFREMRPGDDYPRAYALAQLLLKAALVKAQQCGIDVSEGSSERQRLVQEYVPPYDPCKFPNKWRKMEPDKPTRTLMAHLGKDCYSHIHYDSSQARVITVREAARLQSFP